MTNSVDIDGNSRILAGTVDIGAYETAVVHHVTVSCGANGSIAPGGVVAVVDGADQIFQILPDADYKVEDVLVDDVSVGAVTSLTLSAIAADHVVRATFVPASWAKADFAVETIQLATTTLAPGAVFGATVTVRNRGGIAGDAGMLRVWVSHAPPVAPGEAGNAEQTVGGLAPGESRTLTFAGLTAAAAAGTYQFRACVDADNVTPEYSWGDNQLPVTYTTVADGSSDPGANVWERADFAVTHQEFIGPSPTVANEVFAVRVTVENRGQIAGDAGNLGVFVSHASPVVVGETGQALASVGILQPGESRTLEIGGLVAAAERGAHLLRSYVDIDDVTTEWSEGDNQLPLTYQISPVFLHVQPVAGGIALSWNSFWGDRYIVYRAGSLSAPFVPLATDIEATPPTNGYIDVNPPPGGAFYKIGVQPWGAAP